jgi:hypothetical protein
VLWELCAAADCGWAGSAVALGLVMSQVSTWGQAGKAGWAVQQQASTAIRFEAYRGQVSVRGGLDGISGVACTVILRQSTSPSQCG